MDAAQRLFLRHTLATLAYRAGKSLRGAPEGFSEFKAGGTTRTPSRILAHLGDLLDWALSMARGQEAWHDSKPLPWAEEVARFFQALRRFDEFLAGVAPLQASAERLFQGPVADALTHVGQIAMLRRMAACPIRGENYFRAEISTGRVGLEQASPVREFD
jgi:hypothetical protein